jgi:hypothetical protein
MLITNGSRQCIIKLKEYSDKKVTSSPRNRVHLTDSNNGSPSRNPNSSNINVNLSTSQLTETNENRSLLGRLLNCKPCRQMTDNQTLKNVC